MHHLIRINFRREGIVKESITEGEGYKSRFTLWESVFPRSVKTYKESLLQLWNKLTLGCSSGNAKWVRLPEPGLGFFIMEICCSYSQPWDSTEMKKNLVKETVWSKVLLTGFSGILGFWLFDAWGIRLKVLQMNWRYHFFAILRQWQNFIGILMQISKPRIWTRRSI